MSATRSRLAMLAVALLCACGAQPPAYSPPVDPAMANDELDWHDEATDLHIHLDPSSYIGALREMPLTDEERAEIARLKFARLFAP